MKEHRGRFRELYRGKLSLAEKVAKLYDDDPDKCIRLKKMLSLMRVMRRENFRNDEFMVIGDHIYEFEVLHTFECNEGGEVNFVEDGVFDFCLYTEDSDLVDLIAEDLNDRGEFYEYND